MCDDIFDDFDDDFENDSGNDDLDDDDGLGDDNPGEMETDDEHSIFPDWPDWPDWMIFPISEEIAREEREKERIRREENFGDDYRDMMDEE